MKKVILTILTSFLIFFNYAQEIDSTQLFINQIEESLVYKTGVIALESGNANLTVPNGFRFLDKEQSMYVLTDLFGNPPDSSILGILLPTSRGLLASDSWFFVVTFDEMGYVKDDDAGDINYDDLLKECKKEMREANPERIRQGYQPIEFIGWASSPFYDQNKKILHWAQELKFGEDSLSTLNYNLRILGRKGIFLLNAVGSIRDLQEVKSNIDEVIGSVKFEDGYQYSDFLPGVDNVAAWTIGGLVAGKVLAKVGFFVLLAKFWKLIALAVVGAGGAIWKYFKRRKKDEQELLDQNKDIE